MIKAFSNGFRLIIAEDNMILVNKETGMGAYFIFLGILDSEENYNEILIDEYVEPEIEYVESEIEDRLNNQ